MGSSRANGRTKVVHALHHVLERDNALSRCCAVRALERLNARDKKSRAGLIHLLRDADADVRMDAAAALGRMRITEAVAPLIGNLEQDPEGEVRIEAVKALSKLGSRRAIEPLIRCIRANGYPELDQFAEDLGDGMGYGPWWEVQSQALRALGEIGDAHAAGSVIETLENDDYEDLQETGFRVLARLNNKKAKAFLIEQLKTGKTLTRRRAVQALASLPELRGRRPALPAEFLNPLTSALMDPESSVRIAAARALAGSKDPSILVPLTLLLNDPEVEVRKEVATLFGKMRGKEVLNRLHPLLAERDPHLKRRVASVLGEIGDPASAEPLMALLATDDHDLLYEAIGALGKLELPGPEEKLAEFLADDKIHASVRIKAAWALGCILPKTSKTKKQNKRLRRSGAKQEKRTQGVSPKEVLVQAVCDPNEQVSYAALCALAEIDRKRAVSTLVTMLQGAATEKRQVPDDTLQNKDTGTEDKPSDTELPQELRDLVAGHSAQTSTLAAMLQADVEGAPRATKPLKELPLPEPTRRRRLLAARLLGALPDPGAQALRALRQMCQAREPALQREALLALGQLGDKKGLPAVVKGLDADAKEIRLAALEAVLGFSNVPGIEERLEKLCQDPDAVIRARAVRALGVGRGKKVAERLRLALEDENLDVCRAALAALSKKTYTRACGDQVINLAFRFGGELRAEAAATLRRLNDYSAAPWLLQTLGDAEQEEWHWVCIDALAEMHASAPAISAGKRG